MLTIRAVESVGKMLLIAGAVLAALGGVILLAARFGFPRLPGDILVRRDNFTFYMPLGLMIVLSIVLTIVLNLIARR
jgi:Protein of unknown function (DUF2905)